MKEIQTNGITILLVEVPEDAKNFTITEFDWFENAPKWYLLHETIEDNCGCPIEFDGDWEILGKSTELSEEQMKEICEYKEIDSYDCDGMVWYDIYRNYALDDSYWLNSCDQFFTVRESYLSLLEANGIVDRNNLTNPDTTSILGSSPSGIDYEILDELRDKWQKSQSKVKHYLVLKRI